ncbi:MAG: MBL fold metallo-hydrolase [Phycisphaerales bacterium]|jgi:hydroxyacylglutathione hydrolase|nr:MBL fold metallo-hydrolase [Phycisphaerales bacterium]MBT7170259.1 MBL fold metallo-hydrolase [Phycisphaerales bacterium]
MFFQSFKVPGLGCYSYLIGCPGAGRAMVVDPERHIEQYLRVAADNAMTITHVFDTHLHADHISGALELATVAKATLCLHRDHPASYPHHRLSNEEQFDFGVASARVLDTPGHTPNSFSLLLSDHSRGEEPMGILTGDLLFVGDVGRPDLAGADLLDAQIRNLYDSLYITLGELPDYLEVFPSHGAGSLCGKGISAKPTSVLGFERRTNPLLAGMSFEDFHATMAEGFAPRPPGFIHIVETNTSGPAPLSAITPPDILSPRELQTQANDDITLIDVRDAVSFGGGHIPGSLNLGMGSNMASFLGMIADPDSRVVVIADTQGDADEAIRQFRRVGFDTICGIYTAGISAWVMAGGETAQLTQLDAPTLRDILDAFADHVLLDVRTLTEWDAGHIDRATHLPLNQLTATELEWPAETDITVVCHSGYRANLAASELLRQGYQNVYCLLGGMTAWDA